MSDYIPYQLREQISQIDPHLDLYWKLSLQDIFVTINQQDKENIYQQILRSKGIEWNKKDDTFVYKNKISILKTIDHLQDINIKNFALRILNSLEQLKKYNNAFQIADYLESMLIQIDEIDIQEDLSLQKIKQSIRKDFIYTCADIIFAKKEIELTPNTRNLTTDAIKVFIIEVFLKQKLLGYWFKTMPPRQLAQHTDPLLRDFLRQQQHIRQLEIIKTSKYIFALAPTNTLHNNFFSIRRFLQEESFLNTDKVYFHGVALNLDLISNSYHREQFELQINKIISIEKHVNLSITQLVEKVELYNSEQLLVFLFETLDATHLTLDKLIQQKLLDFEHKLVIHILEPLTFALKKQINHSDEYNYLYISIKKIMSDILSYFHDFQSQPGIIFNKQAHFLESRLSAYLILLKKRRQNIFVMMSSEEWEQKSQKMLEPVLQLKQISKSALKEYREILLEIKENKRLIEDREQSFLKSFFNKKQTLLTKDARLRAKMNEIKNAAYLDIIRVPKVFPNLSVYLEFESFISINQQERHYAFPTGDNGVSRLPILIQLPEDKNQFNLQEICNSLDFDIKIFNQNWLYLA